MRLRSKLQAPSSRLRTPGYPHRQPGAWSLEPGAEAKRLGQFFTPPPVVDFILDLLLGWELLRPGLRILDPACGDAVFLRRLRERDLAALSHLCGLELDAAARDWWRERRIATWPHLHLADGLRDHPSLGIRRAAFDLVIGNPPYGHDVAYDAALKYDAWCLLGRGKPAPRCPVELLFLERFVQLVRPGGALAVILPEGVLVNTRYQPLRDALLCQLTPWALISLPRATFEATGAHSKTAILVARRRPAPDPPAGVLLVDPDEGPLQRRPLHAYLEGVEIPVREGGLRAVPARDFSRRVPSTAAGTVSLRVRRLAPDALLGHPWSPEYWDDAAERTLAELRFGPWPLHPLGSRDAAGREVGFLRFTTYGAVGSRHFVPSGIRYLTPRNLTPTGIDVSRRALLVAPGGPNDPHRSRLREGDILLCNSGVASVGRPALFAGFQGDWNIAQHINLIRVEGIDPYYVIAYLHTRFAQAQLRRFQSGTGAAGINFTQIRAIQIPVPPGDVQARIRDEYAAMHTLHLTAMGANDPDQRAERSAEAEARLRKVVARLEADLRG